MKNSRLFVLTVIFCGWLTVACIPEQIDNHILNNNINNFVSNAKKLVPVSSPTPHYDKSVQTSFHMEEPVTLPINIPPGILPEIRKSTAGIPKECWESNAPSEHCFVASNVSINDDDLDDIMVMGQGKVAGANVTSFWVFQGKADGYQLVFHGTGLQLEIGKSRKNDFREIDVVSMSAKSIFVKSYRFSQTEYKLRSQKKEKI